MASRSGGAGDGLQRVPSFRAAAAPLTAASAGTGWLVPTAATDYEHSGLAATVSAGAGGRDAPPIVPPQPVLATGSGLDAWAVAAAEAVHRGALMRAGGALPPRTARSVVSASDAPQPGEITAAAWIRGGDRVGPGAVHAAMLRSELLQPGEGGAGDGVRHAGTVRPRLESEADGELPPPPRRRRSSLETSGLGSGVAPALAFPVLSLDDSVPAWAPAGTAAAASSIPIFDDFSAPNATGPPVRSALSPREGRGRPSLGGGVLGSPGAGAGGRPSLAGMVAVPVVTPATALASPGSWRRGADAFTAGGGGGGTSSSPRGVTMGIAPAVFSPPERLGQGSTGGGGGRGLVPGAAAAAAAAAGVARAAVGGGPSMLLLARTDEDGPEDSLQSVRVHRSAFEGSGATASSAAPGALQRGFGAAASLAGGPALRHAAAQALPSSDGAWQRENDAAQQQQHPPLVTGIAGGAGSVLGLRSPSAALLRAPLPPQHTVAPIPFRVLDAPGVANDFYLHVLDWSVANVMAIALRSTCYLWDAHTTDVSELDPPPSTGDDAPKLAGISFSGSGDHLAVSTDTGVVKIYDVNSRVLLRTLRGHSAQVSALSWAGPVLATGSKDKQILFRDVREPAHSFACIPTAHTKEVCSVRWSPDWELLASGGNDNSVKIWDAKKLPSRRARGERRQGSRGEGRNRRAVTVGDRSAPGWSASGATSRSAHLPDDDDEEEEEVEGDAFGVDLHGDIDDQQLSNASSSFTHPSALRPLSSSSGTRLSSAFDAAGPPITPLWNFDHHRGGIRAMCWCPHQRGVFLSGGGTYDRCVRVYSTSLGEQLAFVDTGAQVTNILWGWDPSRFAVTLGFNQNAVTLWNYPSLTPGVSLTGHTSRVLYATVTADQETVVTGAPAPDETIRFWRVFPRAGRGGGGGGGAGGAGALGPPPPGDIGDELEMPTRAAAAAGVSGGAVLSDDTGSLVPVRRGTGLAARLFATAAPSLLGLEPVAAGSGGGSVTTGAASAVGFSGSASFASAASPPPGIR